MTIKDQNMRAQRLPLQAMRLSKLNQHMSKYYIQTNNHVMALSQLQFFVFNDFYTLILIFP